MHRLPIRAQTSSCPMLTYEQALSKIVEFSAAYVQQIESVDFRSALGRVLAGPIEAGFDLPRFNNSGVDGYGVIVEDLAGASEANPVKLRFDGQVAAGASGIEAGADQDLKPGHCLRILTGAPVPDSVEAVVMKEYCQVLEQEGVVEINCPVRIGENIRMQGEEVESGTRVLGQGVLISPPIVGLLATLGQTEITVFRQPRVAVISTGDELVEPGVELQGCQIYNSNTHALVAALRALGIGQVKSFHTKDDREQTRAVLEEALAQSDVVISIGGVSVGERDYVKETFEALNVRTVFWRISMKPGKPVYFGVVENGGRGLDEDSATAGTIEKVVFGLPGNPVSALVTFNLFVKPALKIMQGLKEKQKRITSARLARNLKKKAGRLEFVRGTLESAEDGSLIAYATTGQESHMLTGLAAADCLMLFAGDLEFLPEGATLPVQILNWHE
jgi:molybdopterin molybdotransferase